MNNFAISSGGLGEALERSASSLAAANNTLNESAALITAANTVVQNPEKVGTAMKTISMRIRGAKTELEDMGESTDGMVESTAKLRQEIKALSGVDIMASATEFKSTYQIMDELSQKWKDLTDIQQASIVELMAGKHQGNVFASLMQNFQTARDALDVSLGASDGIGSAMEEHAKWSESLEARLLKLKATWQSFSQTFMDSKTLKVGLDLLIGFVDVLDKLVGKLGLLGTIGVSAGIFSIFKFKGTGVKSGILGDLSAFGSLALDAMRSSEKLGTKLKDVSKAAGMAGGNIAGRLTSSLTGTIGIIGTVIAAFGLLYNHIKKTKEEASKQRQEIIKSSDDFLNAADSFEQAYIKYNGRTDLTAQEESELEAAIQGTVNALGDKSSALQGIVNSSNDYIRSLEAIADAEIEAAERAAKDKRDNAELELTDIAMGWSRLDGSEVDIKISEYSEAAKIAEEMNSDFFNKLEYNTDFGERQDIKFRLSGEADTNEIIDYYNTLLDYQEKLSDADLIDTQEYKDVSAAIESMSESVRVYTDGVYEAVKAQYQLEKGIPKTAEEYMAMREAILKSGDVEGLSVNTKKNILNTLDSEYGKVFDLSSAKIQSRKLIGVLDSYGDTEAGKIETFLNMRTAVNNNECTVGEYLSQFNEINKMTSDWSSEDVNELNTSFGLDVDSIKHQYDEAYKYISRNYLSKLDNSDMSVWLATERRAIEEDRIKSLLGGLSASELAAVISIKAEIDWENSSTEDILSQIKEEAELLDALAFKADIEVDKTSLDALNTALNESASAIGLTEESIDSLKSKYSSLKSYNPHTLFEKTANGVKVNRDEVAKLEKEYNDLKKTEVQKHLNTLVDEYNKCTKAIDGNIDSNEKLELISKREKYAEQIEELSEYQAQLEGITGAYQRWIDAQNTPQEYEGYQAVATSREDIKDEIGRGFISSASKEYIDLLSGKDLSGATIDEYAEAWKRLDKNVGSTNYSINEFFTINDDGDITATGIDRFFEGVRKDFKGQVYKLNEETGEWYYDFSAKNLEEIKKQWGIGIEAIELILEAAEAAGYDIDWGGIFDDLDIDVSNFESIEAMISLAEKAQEELNKLSGLEDIEFNFRTNNVTEATAEVDKARKIYNDLIYKDGNINLKADGAEQMQFVLSTLLTQKQQLSTPAIMKIDTSQIDQAKTDIIEVVTTAQQLQKAYENYEIAISTGVDVEKAKSDLNTAIEGMKGTSVDVRADLKLPTNEDLENAKNSIGDIKVGATLSDTAIGNIATKIQTECTPEVIAKVTGLDESAVSSEPHQVVYTAEHKDVDNFINSLTDISKKIIYKYTTEGKKPNPNNIKRTITYEYKTDGDVPEAYGTANASGSASGRAFARGNWGIKGNGTALGGELGQELVVRDGRFFTIGDNGAEFFRYKKNDIVFNAAQTESLFKYGGIKGAKPRGTMLANGSAFADGSAQNGGRAFAWYASGSNSSFANNRKNQATTTTTTNTKKDSVTTTTTTSWNASASESDFSNNRDASSSSSKSSSSSSSNTKDEFEETIDWIEIAIDRVERSIDQLDTKANSAYRSWSERNGNLVSEIGEVREEISLQQAAYDRYMQAAAEVGLSASYAERVRSGAIDIETITDEDLKKKIDDYRNYYEAALDCKDAILELQEKESELYKQRFDNVVTQYEGMLSIIEHEKNMLDEFISQSEAQGWLVSKEYYNALIDNEKSTISKLKQEKSALLSELQTAMSSGKIAHGSEAYYEMINAIDEVTLSIEESNTAILEYQQTIQQLDWEVFDLLQAKISAVAEESEFLIELMSNKKLFNDNGQFTDEGMATVGLHGVNYNTYMRMADDAAKEAERIKAQLASDPYDTELEERYREMISLQQEHILAAEQEKDAIKSLVEEGIELELDALQERIDKYNDSIDSARDLYEYNKKVKEQTKEIASLEKQIASYKNDDSEETRAKLQELKVALEDAKLELEETEYDKYIEDQTKLLDDLYLEYETILNTRLDNIDALVMDMIAEVNMNAATISATIYEATEAVGYTLSDSMQTIWNTSTSSINSVITTYGDRFSSAQTTTNAALNNINIGVQSMISKLNSIAASKAAEAAKSSAVNTPQANAGNSNKPNTNKQNQPATPSSGTQAASNDTLMGIAAAIWIYGDDSGWGKDPIRSGKIKEKFGEANAQKVQSYINSYGPSGKLYDIWVNNGKNLNKYKYSAFKSGARRIDESQLAWTQEGNMEEFIIRPSDGAILTPIAKSDSVLNAQASKNIWNMANSPAEFIKDNLKLDSGSIPVSSNSKNTISQNFENVVFSLPNVKNYEQLLSEMQKDKNFEKLILAMTIDQIAGKSKLAKGKAIR